MTHKKKTIVESGVLVMFEREMQKLAALYDAGLFGKPFYSQQLTNLQNPFENYDSFRSIPFMTKEQIRNSLVFERTATQMKDVYGIFSSSGTTGGRTFYVYNREDKRIHEEFVRTFFNEFEVGEEDLGGIMAPVDTGVMAHTMLWEFNTMGAGYVNCPTPSPDIMRDFVEKLPITVIATRPSVVSSVIYRKDLHSAFSSSTVNKLTLGGGFLSEERRKLLEQAWGADCYCLFGMSEMFGPMAAECKHKDGMHYLDDYLMVEILDPVTKEPVAQGETGIAVYTSLWPKGMPLLRYWTDDYFNVDTTPCLCGQELPRLRFVGRMADCIAVQDGRAISPLSHTVQVNQVFFAKELEELLFSHGMNGEYALQVNEKGEIAVLTENWQNLPDDNFDVVTVKQELEKRLGVPIQFSVVPEGSLGYDGHSPRCQFSVTE